MNREIFMRDLARFLSDIPAEERESALKYYEDYFDDAGAENEQKVIEELGSPVDVAKQIKAVNREQIAYGEGSAQKNIAYPNVMQQDTSNSNTNGNQANNQYQNYSNYSGQNQGQFTQNATYSSQNNPSGKSWTQSPGKVAIVVILIILAIPVGLPLVSVLFALAISIIACLFSLFVTLFITGGALLISGGAGIVCTVFAAVAGHYASSILVFGFSLVLISVGLFLLWLGILFCSKGIPAVWRLTVAVCRSIGRGIKRFFKGGIE